jgi:GNAT superfamily N-acetyltransferase
MEIPLNRDISIHEANDSEIEILLSMWIKRATSLINMNKGMWDLEQFTVKELKRKYEEPYYYIGYVNGKPFGGFILIEHDERYWPGDMEKAFYFHKFVVDEAFAGQGLSKEILNWVKDYGKQKGKEYIRLDFEEEREYLRKMYYGNGFKKIGIVMDGKGKEITIAEYKI